MKKSDPSFKYRSQRYWHDGTAAHVTRDGRRIKLRRLYTLCPACGVGFHILTTISAIRGYKLRRRCDACKRQGVPVEHRLPPETGTKRPKGAVKGNPRSGRLEAPKRATKRPPPATIVPPPLSSTPRWLLERPPIVRPPAERAAPVGVLVAAVQRGAVVRDSLGMLDEAVAPPLSDDCAGDKTGGRDE